MLKEFLLFAKAKDNQKNRFYISNTKRKKICCIRTVFSNGLDGNEKINILSLNIRYDIDK